MLERELPAGSSLAGARRDELYLPASGSVLLVAITRAGGEVLREAPPATILAVGDRLVFVSSSRETPEIVRRMRAPTGIMFRGVKQS